MKRRLRLILLHVLALLARPLVRRLHAQAAPARILVIKPDHLGDVLLATPALRALRVQHPHAHITALIGPWAQVVLRGNPDVDAALTLPFPGFSRKTADARRKTRRGEDDSGDGREARREATDGGVVLRTGYWRLRASDVLRPYGLLLQYALLLRAGRYDLLLVLRDDHWWGAALALLAGIPRRVGYAVPECRPFLTDALPWHPDEHVTVQGLRLQSWVDRHETRDTRHQLLPTDLHRSAFIIDHFPLLFHPAPADHAWAEAWLHAHGIAADERLVIVHPGTGGAAKLWPVERWAAVGAGLAAADVRLLLTGGPGEEALVAELAAAVRQPTLTMVGEASIGQLAALLGRATLVLGVDSGPLHLAVAMGTRTLHLYGPGDPARFGPWGDPARHRVLRAGLWCSPCGVFSACPRGTDPPECMDRITAAMVAAAALV